MTDPHQLEDIATYNERSVKTLARAIALSQGRFSLILVRCNCAVLQAPIVQRLRELCPVEIRELVLPKSAETLYSAIEAEIRDEQPSALTVLGLATVTALDNVLTSTNQVRDEFRKSFSFPLVLWINDEVLQKLLKLAPDFYSWAGVPIKFKIATNELSDFLWQKAEQAFAGTDHVDLDVLELKVVCQDLQSRGQGLEPALQARLDFLLGWNDYLNDEIDAALNRYNQSLAFWEQSHNLERQGRLLVNIALAYQRQAEQHPAENRSYWEKTREYLQKYIDIFEHAQRPDLVASQVDQLGEVLRRLQAWEQLQTVAQKALTLHQTYGQPIQLARDYGLLAEVALNHSRWNDANKLAQKALQVLAKIPNIQPQNKVLSHLILALSQQHLGKYQDAISNLETAKNESNPQYDPQLYIELLEALRQLYFKQGQYLEAFDIKQEQRSIEAQYGFRAFIGAGRLQPKRQARFATGQVESQETVAQEIAASGRQQDVNRLIERISRDDCKMTIIHGQSGVGKSSIVTAGLVPVLKQQEISTRNTLPVVLQVYTDCVGALGRSLAAALEEQGVSLPVRLDSTSLIVEQLQENERRHLLTVLILDQFEEFFFACTEQTNRRPFFEFLSRCLDIPYVKVVLSLREDYLHYLLECERLAKIDVINNDILNKGNRYYLGNFSCEDAKSVIQSLTERSQFCLEPALVDELVRDLAGELGEVRPIELQVVGAQLQTDEITTLEKYHQLGPKAKLVDRFLEEAVKDCGSPNERAARLVLYLLTDENGTRPLTTRAELAAKLAAEADKLDLVLKILVKSGLVFLIPEIPAPRYQLIHDYLVALIRQQQGAELLTELQEQKEKLNRFLKLAIVVSVAAVLVLAVLAVAAGLCELRSCT